VGRRPYPTQTISKTKKDKGRGVIKKERIQKLGVGKKREGGGDKSNSRQKHLLDNKKKKGGTEKVGGNKEPQKTEKRRGPAGGGGSVSRKGRDTITRLGHEASIITNLKKKGGQFPERTNVKSLHKFDEKKTLGRRGT